MTLKSELQSDVPWTVEPASAARVSMRKKIVYKYDKYDSQCLKIFLASKPEAQALRLMDREAMLHNQGRDPCVSEGLASYVRY